MIASYGLSDLGCVRSENEDRILVDGDLALFIVADGMGGHSHGEVAAQLAVATIQDFIRSSQNRRLDVTWLFGYDFRVSTAENRLLTAIQLANRRVWELSERAPEYAGMGTTVAAVLVYDDLAAIASVGDSRAYLFRGDELGSLTVDDTWVGAMLRQGTLDASQVAQHPMRNVLTQAAGARATIEVQTLEHKFLDYDLLLLSSDGLHGVVEDRTICTILSAAARAGEGLKQTAARLVDAAREQGAPDNISCILLRYSEATDFGG